MKDYQALIIISFGGPEGPDDVIPFLENVLQGRNVPRKRMEEVAEHYMQFGGVSPINHQNRELISEVEKELVGRKLDLPVYFGNRNWHPMLADTLGKMKSDGIERAAAFFTSAFSSYSGCRQYRENILEAQKEVGDGAPMIDRLRLCFNHPKYIRAVAQRVSDDLNKFTPEEQSRVRIVFTAHSIPTSMAECCNYEKQLRDASRLVAESVGRPWDLVYQSRSGPASQPWLEPDVCDFISEIIERGENKIILMPIGFLSDHMEVLFDLDHEAATVCEDLGIKMRRAKTVGTHPLFVEMIVDLLEERMGCSPDRPTLGSMPANPDICLKNCCLPRKGSASPV